MEAIRGRVGSFSDDDDDTSASCLRSLASPSDEDDPFRRRFSLEENDTRKLQISLEGDDDFMSKGPEEETPKGGCSPLVRSFAQLSTQGRANLFRRSSLDPTTPMRRFSTDLAESALTPRLTPSSQARTLQRQEFKATRVLSETPSRKPCTPSKHARQEFKASRILSETPSRKPCTPPKPRRPLATLNAPLSAVSSTLGSSSKRGVTSGSRLTAPGDASPPRPPRRTSPKQSLAALPAFANSVRPEGSSVSAAFDVDDFLTQPSRPASPPPRHPASRSANRRLSMGELMPSPISKSWPYGSYERHRDTQMTQDGEFPEISHLPAPSAAESSHPGTPIEPKHMVAPTRPRKRGSAVPPSCYRSILSSPLPPAPAGASIHDIPELAAEACPVASANSISDSMRLNKARRFSALDPREAAGLEAFELDRSMSSPNVGHQRTQSLPALTRSLSAPGFPPPLLRQSPEEERNERIRCRALTGAMVLHGTKLLCLDWDRTVVGLHTHSRWIGTDDQLALWIRPVFRNLIGAVVDSNIRIAFVSFSGQTTCIHGAIRKAFGNLPFCNGRFVVRCSDKNWGLEDKVFEDMFPRAKQNDRSKLSHICSAATFFMENDKENANPQSLRIQPQNVVFIDDDLVNVEDASAHDVHSIHMDPNNPDKFLDHLEEMCGIAPSPPLALHMTDN